MSYLRVQDSRFSMDGIPDGIQSSSRICKELNRVSQKVFSGATVRKKILKHFPQKNTDPIKPLFQYSKLEFCFTGNF